METNSTKPMSDGRAIIRCNFNPSENKLVDQIKEKSAELIDLLQDSLIPTPDENRTIAPNQARLLSIAKTKYEEACLWAVKAATA